MVFAGNTLGLAPAVGGGGGFAGSAAVFASLDTSLQVSGFLTPDALPVSGKIFVSAQEGDAVIGDFLRRFRLFGVTRWVYRAAPYSQHRYGRECRSARSVHSALEVWQVTVVVFQITVVDDNEVGERVFFAFCGVVLRHKIRREPAAEGVFPSAAQLQYRTVFTAFSSDRGLQKPFATDGCAPNPFIRGQIGCRTA